MLKTIVTLVRGASNAAEEEFRDRHALLILDQQIRDAAQAVERSKRALAVAIAHQQGEEARLAALTGEIADLEERAVAALQGGREDLAQEAAETLAHLESDRAALAAGIAQMASDIARLRKTATQSERRLAELNRGRRTAEAAEMVRRLRSAPAANPFGGGATLAEAEATLARLKQRQTEDAATAAAFDELGAEGSAQSVAEKLEASGFGKQTRPTAAAVLDRLRQQAAGRPTG